MLKNYRDRKRISKVQEEISEIKLLCLKKKKNITMTSRIEQEKFYTTRIQRDCLELLEINHWTSFLNKCSGNNEKSFMEFAASFDGEKTIVGNCTIRPSKNIMAQIIALPQEGERYFKTKKWKDKSWELFICRYRVLKINWKKVICKS